MKVEYPILPSDGIKADELTKEQLNERYYGHNNSFGFYPIGRLNSWHGGIHIERSSRVRAIADGKIIAYRITEEYLKEKDSERTYSNNFILVQHYFETPKKQKIRFYSLYMHLLPLKYLENNKTDKKSKSIIPNIYAKFLVKTKTSGLELGLRVREYVKDQKKKPKDNYKFIPRGTIIKTDNSVISKAHWAHGVSNQIVCKYDGKVVIAYKDWLEPKGNDYVVKYDKAKDKNTIDKSAKKGTMLYDDVEGQYVEMAEQNKDYEIEKTANPLWFKIKNEERYLLSSDCSEISKKVRKLKDGEKNKVINCNIPIKAGEIIGIPADYNFEKQNFYKALHLEVFTDDKRIKEFLQNKKEDDDKTFSAIEEGKKLLLARPCDFLKKGSKVKIYKKNKEYTQIGFEEVTVDVSEKVIDFKHDSDGEYTKILDETALNKLLSNALNPLKKDANGMHEESRVFYKKVISKYGGTRQEFSKTKEVNEKGKTVNVSAWKNYKRHKKKAEEEIAKLKKTKKKVDEFVEYRVVKYKPEHTGKKYWVENSKITGEANKWVTITDDNIKEVYDEEPKATTKKEITVEGSFIKVRKAEEVTVNNVKWSKVEGKSFTKDYQGWIKSSEITNKNPYNWEECGFELKEDTGNQYFYQFGKKSSKKEPPQFIKDIWAIVDEDKDKVTEMRELQRAMTNPSKVSKLSKLICKHPNEWDTKKNISSFKDEVEEIYKKGIDQEKDTEKQNELKKAKDAKIALLEDKINNLCFWDDIEDGSDVTVEMEWSDYVPDSWSDLRALTNIYESYLLKKRIEKTIETLKANNKKSPRNFPKSSKDIYHFHPIAFVQHMKLITANDCYCYKMGIVDSPCSGKGKLIEEKHYDILSQEMGVEKNVFKAVAKVESGGGSSFISKEPQRTKILYERHYAYSFVKKEKGLTKADELKNSHNDLFNNVRGGYIGGIKEHDRLNSASEQLDGDRSIAIKSASWGKFQVMGKYYYHLYDSPEDLEKAQNMCEIQQFRYFRTFLEDVSVGIIKAMKEKKWKTIARKYNGPKYYENDYDNKMKKAYEKFNNS